LAPNGDELLRLLGREPAPQGIFEPAAMPALVAALEAAANTEDQARAQAASDDEATGARSISLRQRIWPMVEMLRRAQAAGEPIVWGV